MTTLGHSASSAAIVVRPASDEDIEAITSIEQASFADPWSAGSFRALLEAAAVHFAVAAVGEQVLGYVVMWLAADEAEIANLAVIAGERRRGVGVTLLQHAVATARASNATVVFLEVRESNAAARALYASQGFTAVGRRKRYYRRPDEDALVLRLDVA